MATPASTPMRHAPSQGRTPSQSQHGTAATPPVSTPFSTSAAATAFSPHGPRSSPQQFKKSPATSTTLLGHPANGPVNFDSPSAAAALGALGLSDIGLGGLGGLSALGRVDDDERARRLDAVIDILNRASRGVVSEAGLERLAKRIGLEYLWEDGMGIDSKSRTLIIAGSVLALDIVLSNNIVQSVTLAFPEASEIVTKHVERAGKILLDDLQLGLNQSPLTKRLDRFGANLERLALLDKLSVLPALNLYEAIAGMYESLKQLHEWEVGRLRTNSIMFSKSELQLLNHVLCRGSGHPAMHARDRVGLSLDYWKEKRLSLRPAASTKSGAAQEDKTWGAMVGCAPLHGLGITPARVSDKWVGPRVEKLDLTDEEVIMNTGPVVDWLNPDDTILTPAEPTAGLDPGVVAKLPEVMFLATFDPPVIVPLAAWESIHSVANLTPTSEFSYLTFDNLLFPVPSGTHHDPSEPRTITVTKKVPCVGLDKERSVITHRTTLFIYKPVYGRTVAEMPFSHPRQLIAILPYLRQYAFLSTLLASSFGDRPEDLSGSPPHGEFTASTTKSARDEFTAFMDHAENGAAAEPPPLPVDVTLTAHPLPRLQIVFPFRAGVANVLLEIRLNAEVIVVSENITGGELDDVAQKGKGKEQTRNPETLARLLETSEDIGRWCAWIRSRW